MEESYEEITEVETAESSASEEEEVEEISVNVQMLEAMLERLSVLEKLAKGEMKPEEAVEKLGAIAVPEVEKRRRRRRK